MANKKFLVRSENGKIDDDELDALIDNLIGPETEEEKALPEPTEEEVNAILDKMFPDGLDF